jgi:DNA-binding ferritin-like protein
MKELQILLRSLQLYAHSCHHLAARVVFLQDHEFLAEIYNAAETDYDAISERIIGMMGEEQYPSLGEQMKAVFAKVKDLPLAGIKQNAVMFNAILQLEQEICAACAQAIASGVSEGTKQLIGDICNRLEVEQYKIKQRVKA